jgi:hypothetical protein
MPDAYSTSTADPDSLREQIAHALFRRRGFAEHAWTAAGDDALAESLRRDCRWLADAVLEVLGRARSEPDARA